MRIAAAREWSPEPGTVIDWQPTTATREAARNAPAHPVGPSFLQRDHIVGVLAQRAEGRPHRAFTCVTVPVAETLDVPRMTAALTGFLREHTGWRSTFRIVDGDVQRAVVPAEAIDLKPVVAPAGVEPTRHLAERLPEVAVFDAFPAVGFGAVAREGSFDFYFGIDHAFGDASSQAIGLAEILDRYHGTAAGPRPVPGADHLAHTAGEYVRAAELTRADESVRRWSSILGGAALPGFPLALGIVGGEPQRVYIDQQPIVDAAGAERLSCWARSAGVGFSAVVFAALGVVERRLAGRERYRTATVLSTRRGDHLAAQGWYINFLPIDFVVSSTRLVDVVGGAAQAVHVAREMALDPAHGALGVLIASGELDPSIIGNPQMVSYLDFRWFPAAAALRDALLFTGEGVTDHASIWISRTDEGLFAATQRPDNDIAEESVAVYFQMLREVLDEVVVGVFDEVDR